MVMLMLPSSPIVDEAALGVLLHVILEGQWEVSNPPTRFSYSRMAFSGHFSRSMLIRRVCSFLSFWSSTLSRNRM